MQGPRDTLPRKHHSWPSAQSLILTVPEGLLDGSWEEGKQEGSPVSLGFHTGQGGHVFILSSRAENVGRGPRAMPD